MPVLDSIIRRVRDRDPDANIGLIRDALAFADQAHGGRARLSGDPLSSHLVAVSEILSDLNMDDVTIVAGLLHETVQHTDADLVEVRRRFGDEVADVVESLTRLLSINYKASGTDTQAEYFRRLILSMSSDVRVVMIKLADQLHNMRTLDHVNRESQFRTATETLDIYAPLANRLGIHRVKSELEDLGFRYTQPEVYAGLMEKVGQSEAELNTYVAEVKGMLDGIMAEQEIEGEVHGRLKHILSIYRKMIDQDIPFEKVYDRVAFRMIVGDLRDCYALLGAVHARWTPVPGRFKDYIAMPKRNLYQSLHTSVIGPRGQPMEVQIRTHEMHRIAEQGIAAHWRYKEKRAEDASGDRIFQWLRQLVETTQEEGDAGEFLEDVKEDLFPSVVYVFTPAGDVMELPRGSTPVDFAFNVHSQVGSRCVGAKVNDRMVALNHVLQNGDRVEIVTSKNQTPSADWLEFVKSSKARNRIRQWIRTEQRERSMNLGRDICDREFRKVGKSFSKALKEGLVAEVSEKFGCNKPEEVLEGVGFGKISARILLEKVYPEFEQAPPEESKKAKKPKGRTKGIVIEGVGDTMVRFAKCCNPLPMEPVVGFITRGHGLTVHTADCPNLARSEPDRRVDVEWGAGSDAEHPVRILVTCDDRKGMLANITQTLANHDANVVSADIKTHVVGRADCSFEITVENLEGLQKILGAIQALKGVHNVVRVKT